MEKSETKTIISEDVEIVGSVKCSGGIQIDGKINGDLSCTGDTILGKNGSIKGNLTVNSVTLYGKLQGNITAKELIELKSSAKVNGDIRSSRLVIEDGVTFVGKSEVTPSGSSSKRSESLIHEIGPSDDNKEETDHSSKKRGSKDDGKGKSGGIFSKS